MERFIVAVSGGVDSVVLLDKMTQQYRSEQLVVAHFDHGIRAESVDDAAFVKSLADKYGVVFETKREELGSTASEERARDRRYSFLREVAKKHRAKIMTAHHADDVVETIAINLVRGTGWRGLAVLDSPDIERPLLAHTKEELIAYARKHGLEWREDATNSDTKYLRNDLRQKLTTLDDETKELLWLYRSRQVALREMIDTECQTLIHTAPYSRYLLIHAPSSAARELLRAIVVRETGQGLTRPQLDRALVAIKTFQPGKRLALGVSSTLRFTATDFVVE